jgi:hypothetical protein
MEMRTLKLLEFAAIFGVIAWFWFSQGTSSRQPKQADEDGGAAASKPADGAPEKDDKPAD